MWELLLVNPQIPPSLAVRLNTYLNIPQPGQLTQPPPSPTATPTASPAASVAAP
jgi:hypothetical protein